MTGQGSGNLRWVVCEALRAAGPALLADDGAFRSYVAAWGNQADPLVQTALATVDAQALAPLAQAMQAPDVASLARARYAMYGALCQRGVGEEEARGVANAVAGGAADLFGVALPDMPAQQQVARQVAQQQPAYPQQQAQYQQQPQQAAYPQQPMYQQAQQPAHPQQYPQQAAYPQPARKKKFLLPLAIAGGLASLAAVAALVFFVVLPMLGPKGVWICANEVWEYVNDDGSTSSQTCEYTLDEQGRRLSEVTNYSSRTQDNSEDYHYSTNCAFTYGNDGLCSTEEYQYKYMDDEPSTSSYAFSWQKDSKGRVTGVTVSGDGSTETRTYEYNQKGNIVKQISETVREDGTKDWDSVEYDSDGLRSRGAHSSTDDKGSTSQSSVTYEYERDLAGRVTTMKWTVEEDGSVRQEGTCDYEYGSDGNVSAAHQQTVQTSSDGTTSESSATCTYSYTYIEDPDPWVVQQARLGVVSWSFVY